MRSPNSDVDLKNCENQNEAMKQHASSRAAGQSQPPFLAERPPIYDIGTTALLPAHTEPRQAYPSFCMTASRPGSLSRSPSIIGHHPGTRTRRTLRQSTFCRPPAVASHRSSGDPRDYRCLGPSAARRWPAVPATTSLTLVCLLHLVHHHRPNWSGGAAQRVPCPRATRGVGTYSRSGAGAADTRLRAWRIHGGAQSGVGRLHFARLSGLHFANRLVGDPRTGDWGLAACRAHLRRRPACGPGQRWSLWPSPPRIRHGAPQQRRRRRRCCGGLRRQRRRLWTTGGPGGPRCLGRSAIAVLDRCRAADPQRSSS